MLLILWHNVIVLLTLFPGIITLLLMRIPGVRNCSTTNLFLTSAWVMVACDVVTTHPAMLAYCLMPAVLIFAFLIEVLLTYGFSFFLSSIRSICQQTERLFARLILIPFFEEYVYRFFLYELLVRQGGSAVLFLVASVACFVIAHFYTQKEKALTKIPIGLILALAYSYSQNIFLPLSVHIGFNLCVFFYNQVIRAGKHHF